LAVLDETALSLSVHVMEQTMQDFAAEGKTYVPSKGELLVAKMVKEFKRPGRAAGAGFYDYPVGDKKTLWPGLAEHFGKAVTTLNAVSSSSEAPAWDMQTIKDRLLYRQAIETARCLHEGVLTTVHDANIGSIFGIGFPVWTGGALQFIYGMGIDAFSQRAMQLAAAHGSGFALEAEVLNTLRRHQPVY
jgi:3-hydroxyacyl-CoA dehydrogenase / enoyl-CoA hydratase / 3-hydroxybutyryl-CoA epimerase